MYLDLLFFSSSHQLNKSSSQILLTNVVEATIGKRRSFDKAIPYGAHIKDTKKVMEPPPIIAYLKKHVSVQSFKTLVCFVNDIIAVMV